jgi:hypothetical protein
MATLQEMGQKTNFMKILGWIAIFAVGVFMLGYFRLNGLNNNAIYTDAELTEVYAIGVIMPVIAFPLFPEAAKEHLGLMTNGGKNVSDDNKFFLRSKVVKSAVKSACEGGTAVPVTWNLSSYAIRLNYQSYVETRTALALNGAIAHCQNGRPTVRIKVDYPRRAMARFIVINDFPVLQIQESSLNNSVSDRQVVAMRTSVPAAGNRVSTWRQI